MNKKLLAVLIPALFSHHVLADGLIVNKDESLTLTGKHFTCVNISDPGCGPNSVVDVKGGTLNLSDSTINQSAIIDGKDKYALSAISVESGEADIKNSKITTSGYKNKGKSGINVGKGAKLKLSEVTLNQSEYFMGINTGENSKLSIENHSHLIFNIAADSDFIINGDMSISDSIIDDNSPDAGIGAIVLSSGKQNLLIKNSTLNLNSGIAKKSISPEIGLINIDSSILNFKNGGLSSSSKNLGKLIVNKSVIHSDSNAIYTNSNGEIDITDSTIQSKSQINLASSSTGNGLIVNVSKKSKIDGDIVTGGDNVTINIDNSDINFNKSKTISLGANSTTLSLSSAKLRSNINDFFSKSNHINLEKKSTIIGSISFSVGHDYLESQDSEIQGDILSLGLGSDITINNSIIKGNLKNQDNSKLTLDLENNSEISNGLNLSSQSGQTINILNSVVNKGVDIASTNVNMSLDDATINGGIQTAISQNLIKLKKSTINGGIVDKSLLNKGKTDISLSHQSHLVGNVSGVHSLALDTQSDIKGDVALAGSNAALTLNNSSLNGSFTSAAASPSTLSMSAGANIEGNLLLNSTAEQTINMADSHITGNIESSHTKVDMNLIGSQIHGDISSKASSNVIKLSKSSLIGNVVENSNAANAHTDLDLNDQSHLVGDASGVHSLTLDMQSDIKGDVTLAGSNAALTLNNSSLNGSFTSAAASPSTLSMSAGANIEGNLLLNSTAEQTINMADSHITGNIASSHTKVDMNLIGSQIHGDISSKASSNEIKLSKSSLIGNVVESSNATNARTDLDLNDQSHLVGKVSGIHAITLDNSSIWQIVDNSDLNSLHNDGHVVFIKPNQAYHTLTVAGDLMGNGLYEMNTDLAADKTDLIKIAGQVSGNNQILVKNTGAEASKKDNALQIVLAAGDAKGMGSFKLSNRDGIVNAGLYQYKLEQDKPTKDGKTAWSLVNTGKKTESAETSHKQASIEPEQAIWASQAETLSKHFTDLRQRQNSNGLWTKAYGSKLKFKHEEMSDSHDELNGIALGYDRQFILKKGQFFVGARIDHAKVDQTFGVHGTGSIKSNDLALYFVYAADNGFYANAILSRSNRNNHYSIDETDGSKNEANYREHANALSVDVGKTIQLKNHWFIDPQLAVSQFYVGANHYKSSNGLAVDLGKGQAFMARLGSKVGQSFDSKWGQGQWYVKGGMESNLSANRDITINKVKQSVSVNGTNYYAGFGVNQTFKKTNTLFMDFECEEGKNLERPWSYTIGFRKSW